MNDMTARFLLWAKLTRAVESCNALFPESANLVGLDDGKSAIARGVKESYQSYHDEISQVMRTEKYEGKPVSRRQMGMLQIKLSSERGVGNCGEMAMATYRCLKTSGVKNINVLQADDVQSFTNHLFVAVGLPGEFKAGNVSGFPPSAIVVDVWMQRLMRIDRGLVSDGIYKPITFSEFVVANSEKKSDFVTSVIRHGSSLK